MHPKNVPITIVTALCLGVITSYTYFYGKGDVILLGFVIAAATLGGIVTYSITKSGVITHDEFNELFSKVLTEIEAHRLDHSVRAYNPKSVGTQLTSLTASIVQLDTLLRERIGRNVKKPQDSSPQPQPQQQVKIVQPTILVEPAEH